MLKCWTITPENRPSFKDLVSSITILMGPDVEDESAQHNELAMEETFFTRPMESLHQARPDDGSATHLENADSGGQEDLESGTSSAHYWNAAEYLIIVESPMLPTHDSIREDVWIHDNDVIMSVMASQITSLMIDYSTVYTGADQRKHQSSASLAFVRGIHRWPVNSPHTWPVTRKMFPFVGVVMEYHSMVLW